MIWKYAAQLGPDGVTPLKDIWPCESIMWAIELNLKVASHGLYV